MFDMSSLSPGGGSGDPRSTSQSWAIALQSLFESTLLLLALVYLGFADGSVAGWLKLVVFGLAAWLVAYLINRLAVEKGVSLAAKGSKIAGPLSGLSVALVGTAFFIATSAGLMARNVEEMRLAEHLEALGRYVDGRVVVADKAAELMPIMQAMAKDLHAKSEQEGETGWGPIANTLKSLFNRADGLSTQMTVSLGVRQAVLDQIAALRGAMETTLADETMGIWDRRATLRKQHGQMLSLLAELDKAVPVSMVSSYARELQGGVLIPNREDASAKVNRTLSGYAGTLVAALEEQNGVAGDPPRFPSKTGALDTFRYAGKFAPVLLLTFIIDLVCPLLIWGYTLMTITREYPRAPKPPRPDSIYEVMTRHTVIDPDDLAQRRDGLRKGDKEVDPPTVTPPRGSNRKPRH